MDEARAAFYSTVSERSKQKNSAYHKRGGTAANGMKKTRMTNREIEEKHGECKEYDLSKFMTFEEFQQMPLDLQVSYLNKLQDQYDVGLFQINREVFGNKDDLLRAHLKIKGILKDCHPEKKRAKTGLKQLLDDVAEQKKRDKFAETIDICQAIGEEDNGLSKFMIHEDFLKLTDEQKVIFVNRILDEYGISLRCIPYELGWPIKNNTYLSNIFNRKHLTEQIHGVPLGSFKGKAFNERMNRFRNDISIWKEQMPVEKEITEEVHVIERAPITKEVDDWIKNNMKDAKINIPPITTDPMLYHDASFVSNYIREGLDEDELQGLIQVFKNKKIRVELRITML